MTTKTSPLLLRIKDEVTSEEIKEYAETAMNELLGWYGYGDNDRSAPDATIPKSTQKTRMNALRTASIFMDNNNSMASINSCVSSTDEPECGGTTSSISSRSAANKITDDCGWCKRPVSLDSPEFLVTPEGSRYCSETCFSQSRRASFKRAKTCDWCKHIRHAVSYVDFQDGASQLQFCSDKCLNQYKMQIFCKETQAHLDMNPHLRDNCNSASNMNLITPDLWLKNCRSRSASPNSDRSKNTMSPASSASASGTNGGVTASSVVTSTNPTLHATQRHDQPIISIRPAARMVPNLNAKNTPMSPSARYRSQAMLQNAVSTPPSSSLRHTRRRRSLRLSTSNCILNNNNSINIKNNNYTKIGAMNKTQKPSMKSELTRDEHANETDKQPLSPSFVVPPNGFSALPNSATMVGSEAAQRFLHPLIGVGPHLQPLSATATQPSPLIDASMYAQLSAFGASTPPLTVLVPYPIVLPLPIPIAIPLSIECFLKAAELHLIKETADKAESMSAVPQANHSMPPIIEADSMSPRDTKPFDSPLDINSNGGRPVFNDQPLDFTKTKGTKVSAMESHAYVCDSNDSDSVDIQILSDANGSIIDECVADGNDQENSQMRPFSTNAYLPNFKSARSNMERRITKEYDSSRPLRKRKQIIDCDYSQLRDGQKLE